MKWGTFIAVDRSKKVVKGANKKQMPMEEYMQLAGVHNSQDVIGPFETDILEDTSEARAWRPSVLHTVARQRAKTMQRKLADAMFNKPISLAEHCEKESGFKIGTQKHADYMRRHYSNM